MFIRQDLIINNAFGLHAIYIPEYTATGSPDVGTVIKLNETGYFLMEKLSPMDDFHVGDAAALLQEEYGIDEELATNDSKMTLASWLELKIAMKGDRRTAQEGNNVNKRVTTNT